MKIRESIYKCWHCKTLFNVTFQKHEGQVCGSCVILYCPFCGGNKAMGGCIMDATVLKMEIIRNEILPPKTLKCIDCKSNKNCKMVGYLYECDSYIKEGN